MSTTRRLGSLWFRVLADGLEAALALLGRSPRTVVLPLLRLPGAERLRWHGGRLRAWRTATVAARTVPAYRDLLAATGTRPPRTPRDLAGLPVTDKASYVVPHRIEDLCRGGRLPARGLGLDESSGSTGHPTSWARGAAERRATSVLLQATFARSLGGGGGPARVPLVDDVPVVLNAFSLGAWATGMSVSTALGPVTRLKSTGPDVGKVVETMRALGPGYRYVLLGYPPFLKDVADDPRIDLTRYEVAAGFGGEAISESMRSHLLQHYTRVLGSYGASDLEINIAAETDLGVAVRRRMAADPALRRALTGREDGPLPMVFQYNPLDYVLETSADGELLVTVARRGTLSPRVRYDIHDLGTVVRLPRLRRVLRAHGCEDLLALATTDLPLLLHGGRSDASVDFYGAVVTVDEVREALYAEPALAAAVRRFRLLRWEEADATPRLDVVVEHAPGAECPADGALSARVLARLRAGNGDLHNACRIAPARVLPTVRVVGPGEAPFDDGDDARLKQRYVERAPAARTLTPAAAGPRTAC